MEGCMCDKKQASLYTYVEQGIVKFEGAFLMVWECNGSEWSGNICRDGGVNGC